MVLTTIQTNWMNCSFFNWDHSIPESLSFHSFFKKVLVK
ncbi:hypothetical protein LEP1GSC195_3207 [Leptospira wolbachii serovar Codice str. CDC]|uniref:Uncharacterized protein n=1 Tax=Leptospira wolbachii serovar Codice str. CDC TaxID=1218599 RepID=R9A430_9LEPT|nr:hypothetical protein LEP1GSC195_3207 [Leptospira wolbachii serovar Codice str. CDC]